MSAKTKPLESLSLADLGLSPADVAPTQRVTAAVAAPERAPGEILPAGEDAVRRLADLLAEAKVI
jgi:electron transfer flavoprotein beta subunit